MGITKIAFSSLFCFLLSSLWPRESVVLGSWCRAVSEGSVCGDVMGCELECIQHEAGLLSVLFIRGCPRP